jgi:DnaJ-class molecular chaperone
MSDWCDMQVKEEADRCRYLAGGSFAEFFLKNKRNYYRILHVQPDAPTEVVRASYRTLMQQLKQHPDLGGEHWNASIINEAYKVLVDSDLRREYDRVLFGAKDHIVLGKQHPQQRRAASTPGKEDNGWQPFKPKVVG